MKKLNCNNIKYQLLLTLVILTQFVQAQPSFDDGDDVQDVPAAPIDDWIIPMIIIVLVMVFFYFKKENKHLLNK
jgi:hypothetical protein